MCVRIIHIESRYVITFYVVGNRIERAAGRAGHLALLMVGDGVDVNNQSISSSWSDGASRMRRKGFVIALLRGCQVKR